MSDTSTMLRFQQRLAEVQRLPQNWDSYGADPISSVAVATAIALVERVQELFWAAGDEAVVPDGPFPLNDGGLQLEWSTGSSDFEVEIGPYGELSWLLVSDRDSEARYEQCESASQAELVEQLTRLFGS